MLSTIILAFGAGLIIGWLLCAILATGAFADRCAGCHQAPKTPDRSVLHVRSVRKDIPNK
jgi:hypothetical protein